MKLTSLKSQLIAAFAAVLLASGAIASPIILGYDVANGENINPTTESSLTNHLLGMSLNTYDPSTAGTTTPPSGTDYFYRDSESDSGSGHVGAGTQISLGSTISGYEYAVARYDGKNGGYVLYYLGGASFSAPTYADFSGAPKNFWSADEKFALSHFTAFNPVRHSVPEGGATVGLLGLGLLGLAAIRRKFHA